MDHHGWGTPPTDVLPDPGRSSFLNCPAFGRVLLFYRRVGKDLNPPAFRIGVNPEF